MTRAVTGAVTTSPRAFVAATLLALAGATSAGARSGGDADGIVVRYPSSQVPDPGALQSALSPPSVSTVVFERGTHLFSETLFAFRREGLTICGATGSPGEVVIQSTATPALQIEQSRGITLRDVTLRSTANFGRALRLAAAVSPEIESFADDVRLEGAAFEAFVGVEATVRAKDLTMVGCRAEVTQASGAGLLWEDGPRLQVTRTRFTTSSGVSALAAVLVRGAQSSASEGERARRLILTRNVVDGDFATGFDLADVVDARILGNRLVLPGAQLSGGAGRVGIVVRRAAASALTEDYELRRNTVRGAHYGLWLLNAGTGVVSRNDLGGNGSPSADTRFVDTGGALRMNLQSGRCDTHVERNDFRGLRSPKTDPAVVVLPAGSEGICFDDDDRNRLDRGRPLYLGAPKR